MSGGAFGYQEHKIREDAAQVARYLNAVADTEHIVDWAVSCDTSMEDAKDELFALWVSIFSE